MTTIAQWGIGELTALGSAAGAGAVAAAFGLSKLVALFRNGKAAPSDPPARQAEDAEARIRVDSLEARADAAEAARSSIFDRVDQVGRELAGVATTVEEHGKRFDRLEDLAGRTADGVKWIEGYLKARNSCDD